MNLDEALELFEEIVELCYDTENPRIIEIVEDMVVYKWYSFRKNSWLYDIDDIISFILYTP